VVVGATQKMNKVLVTGASGQLGSEIVKYCEKNNIEVIASTRENMDLINLDSIDKFIIGSKPTHIIHAAAWTAVDLCESNPRKAMDINTEATVRIVKAAAYVGAHVTYISTDYVFDGESASPYKETDKPQPISVYGTTKFMGEKSMRPMDLIVRVSWVCGETGSNIVKTVIEHSKTSNEMSFVTDQFGSPTFAEDAASRIVKMSLRQTSGIRHLTNEGSASWYEFVSEIVKQANLDTEIKPITSEELKPKRPARRPRYSVLSTEKISEEEWEPMPHWKDSLKSLIDKLLIA
jgi:dTDP-4-dehydrorhamnose reductase